MAHYRKPVLKVKAADKVSEIQIDKNINYLILKAYKGSRQWGSSVGSGK